jgi:hypothetical protein
MLETPEVFSAEKDGQSIFHSTINPKVRKKKNV